VTRRGRSILKAVLALFVLALVLVTLGYFPQDVVRRYVEQRIQTALGPGSRIRRMHVVPGRLTTEAYDLVIEGPTYRLTAPRARLMLAPGFLWGQALSFRSVEIERPILEVWPGPPGKPTRPLDQPLVIRDLSVTDGSIVYRHADQGTFVIRTLGDGSTAAHRALRAELVRWLGKARRAGLDDDSIDALFQVTFRSASAEGVA